MKGAYFLLSTIFYSSLFLYGMEKSTLDTTISGDNDQTDRHINTIVSLLNQKYNSENFLARQGNYYWTTDNTMMRYYQIIVEASTINSIPLNKKILKGIALQFVLFQHLIDRCTSTINELLPALQPCHLNNIRDYIKRYEIPLLKTITHDSVLDFLIEKAAKKNAQHYWMDLDRTSDPIAEFDIAEKVNIAAAASAIHETSSNDIQSPNKSTITIWDLTTTKIATAFDIEYESECVIQDITLSIDGSHIAIIATLNDKKFLFREFCIKTQKESFGKTIYNAEQVTMQYCKNKQDNDRVGVITKWFNIDSNPSLIYVEQIALNQESWNFSKKKSLLTNTIIIHNTVEPKKEYKNHSTTFESNNVHIKCMHRQDLQICTYALNNAPRNKDISTIAQSKHYKALTPFEKDIFSKNLTREKKELLQ